MAVSTELFALVCITSGRWPTEKRARRRDAEPRQHARIVDAVRRIRRDGDSELVLRLLRHGLAVILGVENSSSLTSSRFSPVIVTSTLVPACPPIGMTVSRRGAGRQTCWAKRRSSERKAKGE